MRLTAQLSQNPLKVLSGMLPIEWSAPESLYLPIAFQLKLAGVDYSSNDELSFILSTLTQLGFIQIRADDNTMRMNPIYKVVK